jgi:sarcosine oxidase / L-pipecolate oxidase
LLQAERTILATGAWSSRLVNLEGTLEANAVRIAYIKLTEEELERYKSMG